VLSYALLFAVGKPLHLIGEAREIQWLGTLGKILTTPGEVWVFAFMCFLVVVCIFMPRHTPPTEEDPSE